MGKCAERNVEPHCRLESPDNCHSAHINTSNAGWPHIDSLEQAHNGHWEHWEFSWWPGLLNGLQDADFKKTNRKMWKCCKCFVLCWIHCMANTNNTGSQARKAKAVVILALLERTTRTEDEWWEKKRRVEQWGRERKKSARAFCGKLT